MSLQTYLGHEITPPFPPGEAITHLDGVVVISAIFIFIFGSGLFIIVGVCRWGNGVRGGGGGHGIFIIIPGCIFIYLISHRIHVCSISGS